jgi:hypothetical protein
MYGQYKALTPGTKKVTFEDSDDEDDESSNSETGRDKTSAIPEIIIVDAEDEAPRSPKKTQLTAMKLTIWKHPPSPRICV